MFNEKSSKPDLWVLTYVRWGKWNENERQADKSERGSENDEFHHDGASLEESRTVSFEANDTSNRLSILEGYLRASAHWLRSSMLKINIHTWLGNLVTSILGFPPNLAEDFQDPRKICKAKASVFKKGLKIERRWKMNYFEPRCVHAGWKVRR